MAEKVFIIGTVNGEETVNEWPATYAEAWDHLDGQSRELELAGYAVEWDVWAGVWRASNGESVLTMKAVSS